MIPMNARLLTSILALASWSLGATVAQAQADPGAPLESGFSERVDVEIVTVDVWVADERGEPVTGLDAGSFQVLHDGQPVPITHFSEIRGGVDVPAAAAASDEGAAAAVPSHVVVYFDRSRLHPSRYGEVIRSLEEFLDTGAIASERVLILRQDQGVSVEATFGSTRAQLTEAFERLKTGTASGLDQETEARLALEAIRDGWNQSQDAVSSASSGLSAVPSGGAGGQVPGAPGGGGAPAGGPRAVVGGVGSGAGPDACGMFVNQIQPILDSWTRSNGQRVANTLNNLSSVAGFLAGLPGVKALLYLSDGLETQPGAELATYATGFCPAASTELMSGRLSEQMTSGFMELTRHANSNRVTIYSLQTSGLRTLDTGDASRGRRARSGGARARGAYEASKRAGDREGLGLIAVETGGRAIYNQNDLTPELAKISRELGHYYSLAYEPPTGAAGKQGRNHEIEVKMANSALTTRYRRGYVQKDESLQIIERIEGALNLGLTSNPLAVRLGGGAVQEVSPGSFRMPLHVMVPVQNLAFLPQGDVFLARIKVRVMARKMGSGMLVSQDKEFRVQGSAEATGFADLTIDLQLDGGQHLTAIGVQDVSTGEAAYISTMLQIGPEG